MGCKWWHGFERFSAAVAAEGELDALRARIAASGRSVAEIAQAARAASIEAKPR